LVNDSPAVFLFSETPKGAVETAPFGMNLNGSEDK